MGDQVRLSTSDNPPVVLSVPRHALVANSRVFADMLTLGRQSEEDDFTIPLTETQAELEAFVFLLECKEEEAAWAIQSFSQDQWEKLAQLGDKYDCFVVRKVVERMAWKVEATGGPAAFAFTLATLSGDEELIKHTAKRAVLIRDLDSPDFHAGQEWKDRLAAWRTVHNSACFDEIRRWLEYMGQESCDCDHCDDERVRARRKFADAAWSSFDILSPDPMPVLKFADIESHTCESYDYQYAALELQKNLAVWPEFPVAGLTFGALKGFLRYK